MKKRGVIKGSETGRAVRIRSVRKAKPAAKQKSVASRKHGHKVKATLPKSSSGTFIQREERAIIKEEQAIKKEVRREVRFLLSPEEFHVVTFVASLMILSFLFA